MNYFPSVVKLMFLSMVAHAVYTNQIGNMTLFGLITSYFIIVGGATALMAFVASSNQDEMHPQKIVWLGQFCWLLGAITKTGWSDTEVMACVIVFGGAVYLQFKQTGNFALLRSME